MRWLEKVKGALFTKGLKKKDFWILLIAVIVFFVCYKYNMPIAEAFRSGTEISLGYSAKKGADGNFYVLDNGHARLICFDEQAVEKFSIENPSDEKSSSLYMDDFFVAPEGIYISATEWNEMSIAREVILFYDKQGNYKQTLVDRDYSEVATNKHRFYGVSEKDGKLQFVECDSNEIAAGDLEIPYENAFNAVSDAVFIGEKVYVLDKHGIIKQFDHSNTQGSIVYRLSEETDENIVPYRLAADAGGNLYFTDIRNRQVRLVHMEQQNSSVVCSDVDSLTVSVTKGGEYLLLNSDGLSVVGEDASHEYTQLHKNGRTIFLQCLWLVGVMIAGLLILYLAVRVLYQLSKKTYNMPQIVSIWVLVTVIVVSVLLSGMLMRSFANSYRDKIKEQVKSAAYMVANQTSGQDIEQIEATGGFGGEAYERLYQTMEKAFSQDVAFYRQIYCNILKLSEDKSSGYAVAYLDQSIGAFFPLDEAEYEELIKVYETGEAVWNQEINDISGTYLSVKVPVYDGGGKICGAVAVGAETYVVTDTVNGVLTKILASIVIMLMLVWLVSIESMSFANNYSVYKKNIEAGEENVLPGHLIRFIIFLVFTVYNMTATFLPVYIMKKTDVFPKEMREFLGALPITVNIFIIGLMSLFCARLVQKFGLRKIMILSAMCSFAGNLFIFVLPGFYAVCIGLVLDGIGVGLITNTVYVMLTYLKDEVNRTWGLTIYNGACFSGINFGMMLGSMLAVTVGQKMVFCIVAVVWLLMVLLTGYMVKQISGMLADSAPQTDDAGSEPGAGTKEKLGIGRFIGNKQVLGFIALIQNPYIIFGSFVFYYVPIYCDARGYSETICSVLIMLYSQIAVIGSDTMTEWIQKRIKNYSMYAALGMNIIALLVVAISNSMAGMIVALLIMGISAAFGKPVQQNFYLNLEKVKRFGADRAIGVYNFTENIGESLGPIVFGRMLMAPSFAGSVQLFCSVTAGAGFMHYLVCRKELNDGNKNKSI